MSLRCLRRPGPLFATIAVLLLMASCGSDDPAPAPSVSESEPVASGASFDVYFSKVSDDCSEVMAVQRQADGPNTLAGALKALLAGPTSEERAQGVSTFFSEATKDLLISAKIEDGVAIVDFADLRPVIPNASSSCGSTALLTQLDAAVKPFGAADALYSINGDTPTFYEWLQRPVPDA